MAPPASWTSAAGAGIQDGAFAIQAVVHGERADHGHLEKPLDLGCGADTPVQVPADQRIRHAEGQAHQRPERKGELDVR